MKTLKEVALEELEKLKKQNPGKEYTPWEIFVSVFSRLEEPFILTLKADLPILQKIASGLSVSSIANTLGISSRSVIEVAELWGVFPVEQTVDFNPLFLYKDNISLDMFMSHVNEILPIPVSKNVAEILLHNIKRYNDLYKFVIEEEKS